LVIIDPGSHDVRRAFGSQAITELAGSLLLARLRPPILDPHAGSLLRGIAPAFREHVLPLGVLQRRAALAHELRLDGVGSDEVLVTVDDEDVAVFPHPRSVLLFERRQVAGLRQGVGRVWVPANSPSRSTSFTIAHVSRSQ